MMGAQLHRYPSMFLVLFWLSSEMNFAYIVQDSPFLDEKFRHPLLGPPVLPCQIVK